VAVLTAVMNGRSMMGWLYAYSREFMSAGPGRMVLMESLAWACREGIETVDFLPDPEPYKAEWTDLAHDVRDVRLATSLWGRVLVTWYRSPLRRLLVALYMRMPKSIQHLARRAAD
jgi:CelD/BcsL family acetyltransferase involved in cellulose biosynthesis